MSTPIKNTAKEDRVLTQLEKTQANISIWSFLMTSKNYQDALLDVLARREVCTDTTPKQVLSIMGVFK